MNVESVAYGATHSGTPSSLLELVGCGAIAIACSVVIQALLSRKGDLEACRDP